MAEDLITTTGIAGHGAARLPSVDVDSFNIELKDEDGFLGDRASKRAFREILDSWRKPLRKTGEDPFGEEASDKISKKVLDEILVGDDVEAYKYFILAARGGFTGVPTAPRMSRPCPDSVIPGAGAVNPSIVTFGPTKRGLSRLMVPPTPKTTVRQSSRRASRRLPTPESAVLVTSTTSQPSAAPPSVPAPKPSIACARASTAQASTSPDASNQAHTTRVVVRRELKTGYDTRAVLIIGAGNEPSCGPMALDSRQN